MNITEYIESGILEQYVIGSLSDSEMAEVEKNISAHPELKVELLAIENAIEKYAIGHGVAPHLSEDLFVEKMTGKKSSNNNTTIKSWLPWALLGASLLTLLVNNNMQNNMLEASNSKIINVNKNLEDCNKDNKAFKEQMLILMDPENKKILLKGTTLSPKAFASVVVAKDKSIYLASQGLPAPPSDKQYQLWALKDGKPIDMGVFDIKADSLLQIANVDGAQAYAITLENKGGSKVPTLEQMYVMGAL